MTPYGESTAACPAPPLAWRGKAATLLALSGRLRSARVPDSMLLRHVRWRDARAQALSAIRARFGAHALAVRSDADDEDGTVLTRAGAYATRLDVDACDAHALAAAIDAVFDSYTPDAGGSRILLQAMVRDVRACYVAATHTLDELAPYYALSFARGPRSDGVTRGDRAVETWYVAHEGVDGARDPDARRVLRTLRELETLFAVPLESEIVLSGSDVLLLQVRPIGASARRTPEPGGAHAAQRLRAAAAAQLRERAHDGLLGELRLYGQMPDWNPAELLGAHPRPLALSLFRAAISRNTWCAARAALGYRPLPPCDLLRDVAGRPYVDVRRSFNSFLPAGIDAGLGAHLVDAWSQHLAARPELHDKVEFAVATTCVDFEFDARCAPTLSPRERAAYRGWLLPPTRACLEIERVERARTRLAALAAAPAPPASSVPALHAALQRVEAAALDFAGVARQAFAAEALLRSAVACDALDAARFDALRASLATVRERVFEDWPLHADDAPARAAWLERYGHLRPGTFEIGVPSYAERADAWLIAPAPRRAGTAPAFALTARETQNLDALCGQTALGLDAPALAAFYRAAAAAREFGKFVLSRCLSQLLDAIAAGGAARGMPRERLSWLTLDTAFALVAGTLPAREALALAHDAERRHGIERQVKLPPLIRAGDDLMQVRLRPGTPNFLGRGVVHGPLATIEAHTPPGSLPPAHVVAVECADPGFDWIFAHAPLALVTAYGGPNSHMAIRCAETGCRAVLGCGPERFAQLARARELRIDFDAQVLETAP